MPTEKVRATPAARKAAKEYGFDIEKAFAKYPDRRIGIDDVHAYAKHHQLSPIITQSSIYNAYEEPNREDAQPLTFCVNNPTTIQPGPGLFDLKDTIKKHHSHTLIHTAEITLSWQSCKKAIGSAATAKNFSSLLTKALCTALLHCDHHTMSTWLCIKEYKPNTTPLTYYMPLKSDSSILRLSEEASNVKKLTNITLHNLYHTGVSRALTDLNDDALQLYAGKEKKDIVLTLCSNPAMLSFENTLTLAANLKKILQALSKNPVR